MSWMRCSCFPKPSVFSKDTPPGELIGETIYALFLSNEFTAMLLAATVVGVQVWILVEFGKEDWNANGSERAPANIFALAFLILLMHVGGDIFKGVQLMILTFRSTAAEMKRLDFKTRVFLCGLGISTLAFATFLVAINYIYKKTSNVVSAVQDVFIIVFVLEVDEKALSLIEYFDPIGTDAILKAVKVRPVPKDTPIDESKQEKGDVVESKRPASGNDDEDAA